MVTASTPDVVGLTLGWRAISGYEGTAPGPVSPGLHALWGTPSGVHATASVSWVPGIDRGFVRFVTTDVEKEPDLPQRRVGPYAMEFFSRDVGEVHARILAEGTLTPRTPPIDFDMSAIGSGNARSFAARDRSGTWFFFTTMITVPAPRPLPTVPQLVGPAINMPSARLQRPPVDRLYGEVLGIPVRFEGRLTNADAGRVTGLPPDGHFDVLVHFLGDGQMAEHHFHEPGELAPPWQVPARLKPGPCVCTFEGDDLAGIADRAASQGFSVRGPLRIPDFPYQGRPVLVVDGPDDEKIEIIDTESIKLGY